MWNWIKKLWTKKRETKGFIKCDVGDVDIEQFRKECETCRGGYTRYQDHPLTKEEEILFRNFKEEEENE